MLPNRFRQQPQGAVHLDPAHWFGSRATFAITGALPDFNAATGKGVSLTAGGSGFSVRATTHGKSLYTPDGGWVNFDVGQDWAGPNTIVALCRVNTINNPWGGLFSKDTGTGFSTQFAIGRDNATDSLYGSVEDSTAISFGASTIPALADYSVIAFTHSGVTSTGVSYYRNGVLIGVTSALPAQPSGSGVLGLGRSRDVNASYDSDVDWIAFLRAPFVASAAQIKELSDNIWSIWKAPSRKLWAPSAPPPAGSTNFRSTLSALGTRSGSRQVHR